MVLYAGYLEKPHQQSVRRITQQLPLNYLKYIKIVF